MKTSKRSCDNSKRHLRQRTPEKESESQGGDSQFCHIKTVVVKIYTLIGLGRPLSAPQQQI